MSGSLRFRSDEEAKNHYIGWSHETIRLYFLVHSRETASSTQSRKRAPTEALALAHDFWDEATAECGENPSSELVGIACARKVFDWCAAFRVSTG